MITTLAKKGSIAIDEDLATHPFELKHGSLFVLHPKDEETVLCEFFEEKDPTYFKYGNIIFGKQGLSMGLAFRATVDSREVDIDIRKLVLIEESHIIEIYQRNIQKLNKHLEDVSLKEMNEERI